MASRAEGRPRTKPWHVVAALITTVIAVVTVVALPRTVHSTWPEVLTLLREISLGWVLILTVLWIAGLYGFAFLQTAALPGLKMGQAMELNLAGSAIANVIPAGGAVSMGVTIAMMRSWGFSGTNIGVFLILSSVWNLAGRLFFGAIGLGWLVWAVPGTSAARAGEIGFVVTAAALVLVVLVLVRETLAAGVGRVVGRVCEWVSGLFRRRVRYADRFAAALVEVRSEVMETARGRWLRLSLGMTAYVALCSALMMACLMALGAPGEPVATSAAIMIERLVTAVPITPGGAGVAEVSLVACLNVAGVNATVAVASTLLYRIYTFLLEVPVGLGVAAIWARRRAVMRRQQGSA